MTMTDFESRLLYMLKGIHHELERANFLAAEASEVDMNTIDDFIMEYRR